MPNQRSILTNRVSAGLYRGTQIHNIYRSIKSKCYNPKSSKFRIYGGKGVRVCNDWINSFWQFYDWSKKNGHKEGQGMILVRIDKEGNYVPQNCKWVRKEDLVIDRKNMRWFEHDGIRDYLSGWARRLNVSSATLRYRLVNRGMSCDQAFDVTNLFSPDGTRIPEGRTPRRYTRPVAKLHERDGEHKTLSQWADALGYSIAYFSTLKKKYGSVAAIPPRRIARRPQG